MPEHRIARERLATAYDEHGRVVYGLLLVLVGDAGRAQRLLEAIFDRLAGDALQLARTRGVAPRLWRAVHREAFEELRLEDRLGPLPEEDASRLFKAADPAVTPGELQAIGAAICSLSFEQREVVVFRLFAGLAPGRIAEAVEVSQAEIEDRYHRAWRQLVERLGVPVEERAQLEQRLKRVQPREPQLSRRAATLARTAAAIEARGPRRTGEMKEPRAVSERVCRWVWRLALLAILLLLGLLVRVEQVSRERAAAAMPSLAAPPAVSLDGLLDAVRGRSPDQGAQER